MLPFFKQIYTYDLKTLFIYNENNRLLFVLFDILSYYGLISHNNSKLVNLI